jgi:beta-glucanase (GH16 family)
VTVQNAGTSSRQVFALRFNTSGWNLTNVGTNGAHFYRFKHVYSYAPSGALNTITANAELSAGGWRDWIIGTNNTVRYAGTLQLGGAGINLKSGGTLTFAKAITVWSTSTWGVNLYDTTTMKSEVSNPFSNTGGYVRFYSAASQLQLKATVAQAEALIANGKILDMTGAGMLFVTDIGGGYVRVVVSDGTIPAPAQPPLAGTWTTTFEDNFDGTALDGSKWKLGTYYAYIAGMAGTSSKQVEVGSGVLAIKAENRSVSFGGNAFSWASAEVSTSKRFRQAYGYMETRMACGDVKGLWPCFWLMPDRGNYGWVEGNRMGYLRFNLASLSNVTNAQLRLRVTSAEANRAHNINLHPVGDTWVESTLTWNNRPRENPVWAVHDYRATAPAVGSELVYDVTDYIKKEFAGDKLASLVLADSFNKESLLEVGSREQASAANRPRLIVNGTTLYSVADATVRAGTYGNTNYGTNTTVGSKEMWGDVQSTYGDGMEVDVAEMLGIWVSNRCSSAIHWDGYDADHKSAGWTTYVPGGETTADFHVYGLYWAPGLLEFYIDGARVATYSNTRVMSCPAYLILSLQMGGWDGNGTNVDPALYPAYVDVDYVKVWSGTKN